MSDAKAEHNRKMLDEQFGDDGESSASPAGSCKWTEDGDYGMWETGCDGEFTIIDGAPKDNGMNFCPFCGKPIED